MHVHVDLRRVDLEEEHGDGLAARGQGVLEGALHRRRHPPVTHVAVVDEGVEPPRRGERHLTRRHQAGDRHPQAPLLHLQQMGQHLGAEERGDALFEGGGGWAGDDRPPLVLEEEADLRVGQRQAHHRFLAVAQLGRLPLEELAPRGGIEEQVGDVDLRPGDGRRVSHSELGPTRELESRALRGARLGGGEREPRDRGDRRERLASEALGHDAREALGVGELAGRVPFEAQARVTA